MRRGLAGALLATAALAAATPSHATETPDVEASVSYVERTEEGLQILVSVPPDAAVDTDSVAVTIDDQTAPATASPAESATEVRRTAVLVVDTSNSMRGARIQAARDAALTFLDTVPDDVYVGMVTFDNDVTPVLVPTLDRDEARAAVDELDLEKQTRLYEGVQVGIDMAGTAGQRQLLVLSDGADTSEVPLEEVVEDITDSQIQVNVVSLEEDQRAALDALDQLAAAGDGQVISADAEALTAALSDQADVLARQVLVTAQVPTTVTVAEATVAVTLGSDAGALEAEAFAPLGKAPGAGEETPAPAPAASDSNQAMVLDSTWLYAGLGALGVGLVVVVALLVPRRRQPLSGAALATAYTQRMTGAGLRDQDTSGEALQQATQTAERMLSANKNLETRIEERLDGAGNPFKPAEWLLVHVGIFVLMGVIGLLLGGGNLIVGLLFLLLGAVGPWWYLGFKQGRRRKKFESLLPDTLQLISGSLAAGLSLAQSVDTVVKEGQDPIASEFHRVLVETRLGISLDDALEGIGDRFQSRDFAWVVMAIRIQRQVGGNLAELLDTVAATMREREYMRRQVAALAAEGKLSAWVLGGLPPAFMLYLFIAKRDYVMPMFTEPAGWVMIGGALLLLSVGVFWMSRLVKVEV